MAHILLIADLHLIPDETNKINLFIKFCQEHASKAEQLFIDKRIPYLWTITVTTDHTS
jgi:hypothetical protein